MVTDGQTKPHTIVLSCIRRINLHKSLKNRGKHIFGNANTSVFDINCTSPFLKTTQSTGNRAILGELRGIGNEIHQDLNQAKAIALYPQRLA
jgi:hypothetical protein